MKKNEKLLSSISDIDERYIAEATVETKKKKVPFKVKITALAACLAIAIGVIAYTVLPGMVGIGRYEDSVYFNVIAKLDPYYEALAEKNKNNRPGMDTNKGDSAPPPTDNESSLDDESSDRYQETTDNQVAGVIESDIFKRTDKYIYYLYGSTLSVYSIAGEESECLWQVELSMPENCRYAINEPEMYLSLDCKTLTVIRQYINSGNQNEIALITLSTEGGKPVQESTVRIRGAYSSSRLVGDKLTVISRFKPSSVDYDDPETFIPSVNCGDGYECVPADNIVLPDGNISSDTYTVINSFAQADSSLISSVALLSYSDTVYASENAIYVTSGSVRQEVFASSNLSYKSNVTDITRIEYEDGMLAVGRTYTVRGSVLNQYSLDEYKGVLRVVTSTVDSVIYDRNEGAWEDEDITASIKSGRSASLFCIDIDTGELVGKVDQFAPIGEEVSSVRFDGDSAYVCTAVVVTYTDPVFFFDLSDMTNITYTDTGYIDGFSSSLVNMGEGLLLGIGSENSQYDKVETYAEADGEVISIDKHLVRGDVSSVYKSYYVNREENLFGFGACVILGTNEKYDMYVYTVFDVSDGTLKKVLEVEVNCDVSFIRAALIDGYFYIVECSGLKVVEFN